MFVVTRGVGEKLLVGDVFVRVIAVAADHVELAFDPSGDVPLWWEDGGGTDQAHEDGGSGHRLAAIVAGA